jgi:hypothetical protein
MRGSREEIFEIFGKWAECECRGFFGDGGVDACKFIFLGEVVEVLLDEVLGVGVEFDFVRDFRKLDLCIFGRWDC